MYTIQLLPEAFEDLDHALEWYTEIDTQVAQRFLNEYARLRQRMAENPFQFPQASLKPLRKALFNKFPYSLYLMPYPALEVVDVLGIYHQAQDITSLYRRLGQ